MADPPTPPLSARDAKKQAKADLAAANARAKAERPLWKKPLFWVGVIIVLAVIASAGGGADDVADTAGDLSDTAIEEPADEAAEDGAAEEPAEEAESDLTSGQENAIRTAEGYISMSGFSRTGLIEQLKYEGYNTKDAAFAADYLNIDWNEQAVKSAEGYLEMSGFSRSGLIEQLIYEGYTRKQAEYGADKAL